MTDAPRTRPCSSCPYRKDVPSGLWAAAEYDKLPRYDGDITDQLANGAIGLFRCHQQPNHLCAGWVGCHDMENNLAARLNWRTINGEAVIGYESPIPLFSSGDEAAAHGKKGIEAPDESAHRKISQLAGVIARRRMPR